MILKEFSNLDTFILICSLEPIPRGIINGSKRDSLESQVKQLDSLCLTSSINHYVTLWLEPTYDFVSKNQYEF